MVCCIEVSSAQMPAHGINGKYAVNIRSRRTESDQRIHIWRTVPNGSEAYSKVFFIDDPEKYEPPEGFKGSIIVDFSEVDTDDLRVIVNRK